MMADRGKPDDGIIEATPEPRATPADHEAAEASTYEPKPEGPIGGRPHLPAGVIEAAIVDVVVADFLIDHVHHDHDDDSANTEAAVNPHDD